MRQLALLIQEENPLSLSEKERPTPSTAATENSELNASSQKLVDLDADFSRLHSVVQRVHFIAVK